MSRCAGSSILKPNGGWRCAARVYWKEDGSEGKISVACCQLALRVGEAEHNRALSTQAIRRAAQRGANVIVLPELVNSGYVLRDKAEARALAEAEDGPSLSLWGALARELDVAIVAGFCERLPDGEVANSAALIDAQG